MAVYKIVDGHLVDVETGETLRVPQVKGGSQDTLAHVMRQQRADAYTAGAFDIQQVISGCLADLAFKLAEQGMVAATVPALTWRYTRKVRDPITQEWVSVECAPSESDTATVTANVMARRKRWRER